MYLACKETFNFAIGKLLGTPIQVDRAIANKSRLSFARLCIEIDITKPPPEEIVLDICGREVIQQVRWDKIPPYCTDCKHVGHKAEVCYATGKGVRPAKRDYNRVVPQQSYHEETNAKQKQAQSSHQPYEAYWNLQVKNKGTGEVPTPWGTGGVEPVWSGPDVVGDFSEGSDPSMRSQANRAERRHRETHKQHLTSPSGLNPQRKGGPGGPTRHPSGSRGAFAPFHIETYDEVRSPSGTGNGDSAQRDILSSNQYYALMDEGDFETEDPRDVEDVDGAKHPTLEGFADSSRSKKEARRQSGSKQ